MLYNVARIFAQVVGRLDTDRQQDRAAADRRAYYQGRAVRLIQQALGHLKGQERADLLRDMQTDNALIPIRRSAEYERLVKEFGRSAR